MARLEKRSNRVNLCYLCTRVRGTLVGSSAPLAVNVYLHSTPKIILLCSTEGITALGRALSRLCGVLSAEAKDTSALYLISFRTPLILDPAIVHKQD